MIPPHLVFLDAETLPTNRPDLIADAHASVCQPGNMKKAETIAVWWENEGAAAKVEAVRKTSLDGGTGRLASLAWAWGDQPVVAAHTADGCGYSEKIERRLLTGFFDELTAFERESGVAPTLVGHNIAAFDVRWLWKRSIVLGITPPDSWPVNAKPWDTEAIIDTMVAWAGSKDRISQDRLARILGIRGKGDIDGSMVADLWEQGRHDDIRDYCADDVECVRKIWCRLNGEDAPADDYAEERRAA